MRKFKFKYRLAVFITAIITTLIFCCFILYGFITSRQIKTNENNNNKMLLERISTQIDGLYNEMDTAISALSYNPLLNSMLFNINNDDASLSSLDMLTIKKNIESTLGSVLFFPNLSNIYLFNKDYNYFYYTGYYLSDHKKKDNSLKDNTYYESIQDSNNNVILPPHISPWHGSENLVISIYRRFSDNKLLKGTIIEAEIPYSVLKDICTQSTFEDNKEIIILDDDYNILYPANNQFTVLNNELLKKIKINLSNNEDEHFSYNYSYLIEKSEYTNLNIMLLSNNKNLISQSYISIILSAIIALLILGATLGICFFMFNKLLTPLNQLINHINSIDIKNNKKLVIDSNGVDEFEMINYSFNDMVEKLKDSMALTYESQIKEVEASFVALQAQVNPHFLYNTLNSISAASDIYGSEVTQKMCQELSLMLRYTTSNNQETTLIDEINHTKNYLELMKISHVDAFDYDIYIPLELYNIQLPRLIIQPLIENCFKHAFNGCVPPWHISIKCEIDWKSDFVYYPTDDYSFNECYNTNYTTPTVENYPEISAKCSYSTYYRIIIQDNGIGFNNKSLDELNDFINKYKSSNYLDSYKELSIGGLGLKNIYSRLAIFYKSDFNFKVTYENGCKIIIERVINID